MDTIEIAAISRAPGGADGAVGQGWEVLLVIRRQAAAYASLPVHVRKRENRHDDATFLASIRQYPAPFRPCRPCRALRWHLPVRPSTPHPTGPVFQLQHIGALIFPARHARSSSFISTSTSQQHPRLRTRAISPTQHSHAGTCHRSCVLIIIDRSTRPPALLAGWLARGTAHRLSCTPTPTPPGARSR